MQRLQRSSLLPIPARQMWERATTPAGINHELWPVLRMTMPRSLRGVSLDEFPVGRPAGRSWLLLGGVLPVDFDDLCLLELEPPRRFLERSSTLAFAAWEHERLIEADEDGCRVTDRLGFELRRGLRAIPGAARLAGAVVGALFSHRHRRLRSAAGRG